MEQRHDERGGQTRPGIPLSNGSLTYFISDTHLGARYIDDPRAHERRVVNWLEAIGPTAGHLYMLGDMLDFWWEYRRVVPRGHTRFLGALAALTDAGVDVTWLRGNHDIWIDGYISQELGVNVHDGLLSTRIGPVGYLLEHGDGVGRQPRSYRMLRALFRCRPAQRAFSAIHPGLTLPFAYGWSRHSRKASGNTPVDFSPIEEFVTAYHHEHPATEIYLFGHLHRTCQKVLPCGAMMAVLGSWIGHASPYGVACADGQFRIADYPGHGPV